MNSFLSSKAPPKCRQRENRKKKQETQNTTTTQLFFFSTIFGLKKDPKPNLITTLIRLIEFKQLIVVVVVVVGKRNHLH